MLSLLLMLQAVAPPTDDRCVALIKGDPAAARDAAAAWEKAGGGLTARQCLGLAFAARKDWAAAAAAFESAAHDAPLAKDARAATYWAQAGNAWLAAGDAANALVALDKALVDPTLEGLERGEVELDRARALVATGDRAGARAAIDRALTLAADDPLAWLLSATLARQAGDLSRAKADIGQALRRANDDAAVQLEAGNIAAADGDETGAKTAWNAVVRLRPDSAEAKAAEAALAQFD